MVHLYRLLLLVLCLCQIVVGVRWRRVSTQFIAALGDPKASAGTGARAWGIWRVDPGPRGVRLSNYRALENNKGLSPAGWRFDPQDWWLEEHGLIMEPPDFPLPPGQYLVTGDREVTTTLTIDEDGDRWSLAEGSLHDGTHLPCRSARYKPVSGFNATPGDADPALFPVKAGAAMPAVRNCHKNDYWVVFVTALGHRGKAEL